MTLEDFDGDLRMLVDRAGHMGSAIYWEGYYSTNELAVVDRILPPDGVFVDGGAHAGEFTLYAAKRAPRGRVLAFEPMPEVFERLRSNVELNGFDNVSLHAAALSDAAGELELFTSAGARIAPYSDDVVATSFPGLGRDVSASKVPRVALDEVLEAEGVRRLDVLKLDVEGGEVLALRGAARSLRAHRPKLILEVVPILLERAGSSVDELLELLAPHDYELYGITDRKLSDGVRARLRRPYGHVVRIGRDALAAYSNVLCVPPGQPAP